MLALKSLVPAILLFILLDYIWIGHIANPFYSKHLGPLLRTDGVKLNPRILPTLAVYCIFAIMIWYIVLPLAANSIPQSFFYGALLGFVVYGIYDMTNLAVLKDWTPTVALVDWVWGTVLCALTSGFCGWLKAFFSG